jgi:hypothetical protein
MLVLKKLQIINWVWWHTSVIPALGRYRQEDQEFKASLGFSEKKKKKEKKKHFQIGIFHSGCSTYIRF